MKTETEITDKKGDGTMLTKTVVGILLITLLMFPIARTTYADVNGWEAAGLVLAGAVGYAILNDIADDDYSYSQNYYVGRPVYERPRVVRTYHVSRRPQKQWIQGHYETRMNKVWIEGYHEKIWVPQVTRRVRVRGRHGRPRWQEQVVRRGYYKTIWRDGYWEHRDVEVWVEGCWVYD